MKRLSIPLGIVLGFIILVIAGAGMLLLIHTPVEEPISISAPGVTLSADGRQSDCEITLAGTEVTYRFNVDTPHFATDAFSPRQGLFLNGRRVFSRLVLGWEKEGEDCVTYIKNGIRFFTDRELTYVVIVYTDDNGIKTASIAPATTKEEAQAVVQLITSDPYMSRTLSEECEFLLELVK